MKIYVVKPQDSVDSIALSCGCPVSSILAVNQIPSPYALAVGQSLLLPSSQNSDSRPPSPLDVFGYVYTNVSRWVLEQTLPFLTRVAIFSYGFTTEGELIPPGLPDEWIILTARSYGVIPILTLTPLDTFGKFNNALITSIVQDPSRRKILISNILTIIQEKNYGGIDVDFEYILSSDRDAFTEFVAQLTQALRPYGYPVSIALAPKTSADQPGLLYEGKDYAALGSIVSSVLLMTYEWGYKYGPPMAVAPLNQVRRVVEYGLSEIPAEKICLGIPNYGYDWPLPYERDKTIATTIGHVEAVQIAIQNNAQIFYDDISASPYFSYEKFEETGLVSHTVWYEDVRSIQAKFDLIKEYQLYGAGYWQLMRWWLANWTLLQSQFEIRNLY